MKIDLKYPVTLDGITTTAVTLRRAKAKDMRIIARHGHALSAVASGEGGGLNEEVAAATLAMIGSMTDISDAIVDELDLDDVNAIVEKLNDFFPKADSTTPVIGG